MPKSRVWLQEVLDSASKQVSNRTERLQSLHDYGKRNIEHNDYIKKTILDDKTTQTSKTKK